MPRFSLIIESMYFAKICGILFFKKRMMIFIKAFCEGLSSYPLTLAKAMEAAIRQNLCGLYNLVNNTSISKFELLCLFNKYCKLFPVS